MATREEIDSYCEQQWRKIRAPGDWRGVAERFFRWGEGKFWRLQLPWQGILDKWLADEKGKKQAQAKHAVEAAQGGARLKTHAVVICMLCWRPFSPPTTAPERDWVGEMAVCDCACVAQRLRGGWAMLSRVDNCGGRTISLTYEERPAASRLQEDIRRLRDRMMARHGADLDARQSEWLAAVGGATEGAA